MNQVGRASVQNLNNGFCTLRFIDEAKCPDRISGMPAGGTGPFHGSAAHACRGTDDAATLSSTMIQSEFRTVERRWAMHEGRCGSFMSRWSMPSPTAKCRSVRQHRSELVASSRMSTGQICDGRPGNRGG
ncbi:MAG: hypothetical protein ACLTSZ_09530 [Lachnospiraceae bacterium]